MMAQICGWNSKTWDDEVRGLGMTNRKRLEKWGPPLLLFTAAPGSEPPDQLQVFSCVSRITKRPVVSVNIGNRFRS